MTQTGQGSRVSTRELFFSAYQAAQDTVAVFPDLGRTVIEVRGSRAIQVLNGLVTNAVGPVSEGRGCYTFMLGPKGRTVAEFRILPSPGFETRDSAAEGEVLWMDTPSSGLEAILEHFQKYVPPIFAEYAPADFKRFSILGPKADECLTAAVGTGLLSEPPTLDLPPLQAVSFGEDRGLLVAREPFEGDGWDLYAPEDAASGVWAALVEAASLLGGAIADASVWDVLRVERGIPVYGSELSSDRLAQEAGQDERAISFTKGCFTGQEVVARIHYRGHVNRHLRGLRVPADGSPTVGPGVELLREGRKVGVVSSVAESPRFGTIALAYIRREIEALERLGLVDDPDAVLEVVDLPFT